MLYILLFGCSQKFLDKPGTNKSPTIFQTFKSKSSTLDQIHGKPRLQLKNDGKFFLLFEKALIRG